MMTALYVMLLILLGCVVAIVLLSTAAWATTFIKAWRVSKAITATDLTAGDDNGVYMLGLNPNPKPKPLDLRTHSDVTGKRLH